MMLRAAVGFPLKKIALQALRMVRPFLKLTGEQAAAFDLVLMVLGG